VLTTQVCQGTAGCGGQKKDREGIGPPGLFLTKPDHPALKQEVDYSAGSTSLVIKQIKL
jgi:hypothetical protein